MVKAGESTGSFAEGEFASQLGVRRTIYTSCCIWNHSYVIGNCTYTRMCMASPLRSLLRARQNNDISVSSKLVVGRNMIEFIGGAENRGLNNSLISLSKIKQVNKLCKTKLK